MLSFGLHPFGGWHPLNPAENVALCAGAVCRSRGALPSPLRAVLAGECVSFSGGEGFRGEGEVRALLVLEEK